MKWERKKLGDLIDLYDNIRVPLSGIEREKRQGEYPYYGAQSIIDYVNEYLFDGNYILIAEDGENLRTRNQPIAFAVSGQFWVNNHAHIVKGKSNIADDLFIKYFLNNIDINPYVTGAAQPKLSQRNLKEIAIIVPPLPTQRKIASILSAYDDLIENNLKRIKLLEEKAFVTYKVIVSSEKLEKHILSDFGEIITGKTPSTTIADYFGDDVPFIKTPDMHSQIFIEHTSQNLSELGAKSQEKKFLPPLSLCVSCIGTAGVVGITSKPSQTNQQINSILFFNKKHIYYFYALMSQMKEQLDALGSNGSTFTNVNKNKFENMEVFIPNQRVLKEFADEFEAPFNLILTLQKQNTKLREARDILLPKLMNGQIEV
jgi:type I restriction enzyme S subunit